MRLLSIVCIFIIFGCASTPTKYVESSGKQGFSDKSIDTHLHVATFMGNSATSKETAELYAKFRAIEVCYEKKLSYTHILLIKDKTFQKEISQTTTNYPSNYYGSSPYYGYGPHGYGGGYGSVSTQTTNETYTYPLFEVYFECTNKPLDARMSFTVLSQSQMKDFVKDIKGAVQIARILEDSPNKTQLKSADIIINSNGTRVGNILELYQTNASKDGKKFNVDILRDGIKKNNIEVQFLDVSNLVAQSQSKIIKDACKDKEIKSTRAICKR
jgi:hypothetical protein